MRNEGRNSQQGDAIGAKVSEFVYAVPRRDNEGGLRARTSVRGLCVRKEHHDERTQRPRPCAPFAAPDAIRS